MSPAFIAITTPFAAQSLQLGLPMARMLQDGYTAEVTRVCTTDQSPKNVCSMLYAACWRAWKAMGGNRLVTYTLAEEDGASVKAAGWRVVGETKARQQGKGCLLYTSPSPRD